MDTATQTVDGTVLRFRGLEIDDGRSLADIAAERDAALAAEAAELHRAAEERAAAADLRLAQMRTDAAEADARAAAAKRERREASRAAKTATARAARAREAARNLANDNLHTVGLMYHTDWNKVIATLFEIVREAGFEVGESSQSSTSTADHGRATAPVGLDGDEGRMLVFTWYKMQSGNWEIVAYVS